MMAVTAAEMKRLEKAAADAGVPSLELMENAGAAVAGHVAPLAGERRGSVVVVCGPGNNGGDGWVAARLLRMHGVQTVVIEALGESKTADAAEQRRRALEAGVPGLDYAQRRRDCIREIAAADILLDCMFGTGFARSLDGAALELVGHMNRSSAIKFAVDMPSGLHSDSGAAPGGALRADETLALGLPKLGHYLYPGADYSGAVHVLDIGIPQAICRTAQGLGLLDAEFLKASLPRRPRESHKGDYGHVYIIGGSRGMAGSVCMAAAAAMRSGAGLVTVACPEDIEPVAAVKLTEAMTLPLPSADGMISMAARRAVDSALSRASAAVIGCGMGRGEDARELARYVVREAVCPLVIDADALFAAAEEMAVFEGKKRVHVLTPHPGEMARLMSCDARAVQADRVGMAMKLAERTGCVVALKGAHTVIAGPDGRGYIAPVGNPGMAKGGSGDILAGIIGALLGQGMPPETAAACGVYAHGVAGDLCADNMGEAGMIPTDMLGALPGVWRFGADGAGP